MSLIASVLFVTATLAATMTSAQDAVSYSVDKNLCDRFPHLRICTVRKDLDEAMNEIAYFVQTVEQQPQIAQLPAEESISENKMQKRKSAFVRFGKRSMDSMPIDTEGPTNEMMNARETRKSSYIRFG